MTIRDSGRLVDVIVVVPARDEVDRIASCLHSVRISLRQAVRAGAVGHVAVAVVGHHCTDDTLGRADQVLADLPHVLVTDSTSTSVGDVRALGVRAALDVLPGRRADPAASRRPSRGGAAREVWILNTDADSIVPGSWVTDVLAHAHEGHQAVIGMAALSHARIAAALGATGVRGEAGAPGAAGAPSARGSARAARTSAAQTAYQTIIRAGIHGDSHDHVYGANLAVRADAYAAVGGFPSVPVGEDRALTDALVGHGRPVVRPRDVLVTTSARRHGRAVGGLATLLDTLDRAYGQERH